MRKKLQTAFQTRQYMVSKDFEIYYYHDPHFVGVNSHTHDYYEFYFFLEGDVAMHIDGKVCPLKPGDLLLIPPHVPHRAIGCDQNQPYRRFVFWVTDEYFRRLVEESADYGYVMTQALKKKRFHYHYDILTFNTLQSCISRLLEEVHSDRFGKDTKISLCVNNLLFQINRSVYEMDHPDTPAEEQHLYERLIQYIEDHLDENLTLDHLANQFFVSKYHISHVFKENLGVSVHQYITKKRLAMCRDLILNNTDISKAYLMYGFKDYSSFFRAFKKEYGSSPKEYKELYSIYRIFT